ncbi:hypothetical protein [Caballeronia sp.]|jgi:hypothetical protein|uniref:hypothetical protein n=1 Tax=Caballeronia sp. TaxID=1931223 RepID=UPI003C5C7527
MLTVDDGCGAAGEAGVAAEVADFAPVVVEFEGWVPVVDTVALVDDGTGWLSEFTFIWIFPGSMDRCTSGAPMISTASKAP